MAKRKATITLDDDKLDQVREMLGGDTVSGTIDKALAQLIRQARNERDAKIYARIPLTEDELSLRSYRKRRYRELPDDGVDWEEVYSDVLPPHTATE